VSDDLAELLAAERRKTRHLQIALAVVVGLLLLTGGAFAWWADRQAAERRAERDRVAAREAQNRRTVEDALEQTRRALEDHRATEVEDLLRAAEVKRKLNAFAEPREPAPPEAAPAPRAVGP
jgi:predicted ribosomally synthesized peptide with SipW-like signal peptide